MLQYRNMNIQTNINSMWSVYIQITAPLFVTFFLLQEWTWPSWNPSWLPASAWPRSTWVAWSTPRCRRSGPRPREMWRPGPGWTSWVSTTCLGHPWAIGRCVSVCPFFGRYAKLLRFQRSFGAPNFLVDVVGCFFLFEKNNRYFLWVTWVCNTLFSTMWFWGRLSWEKPPCSKGVDSQFLWGGTPSKRTQTLVRGGYWSNHSTYREFLVYSLSWQRKRSVRGFWHVPRCPPFPYWL